MKMAGCWSGWWLLAAVGLAAGAETAEQPLVVRATLELTDGSRLVGTPLAPALSVKLDYAQVAVPLARIRQCEVRHQEEDAVVTLLNGDQMTGTLDMDKFPLDTILGKLTPAFDLITRLTFTACRAGALPAGEGPLAFGGVNWLLWRTCFEVQGDKLVTLPKARPGFNYGHGGHGRSATLMTNIGSTEWQDYRVEFDFCMRGVDPAFNPHGLPLDYRGGAISFHVVDAKESWNECGGSMYTLSLGGDGSWSLGCAYNSYCHTPCGFGDPQNDGTRSLAEGKGLKFDAQYGNKFRVEVCGTGIRIWMDGEKIVDVRDAKMRDTIGGKTLDHGGVGFLWGYDSMGWVRNFSAGKL